ncbi:MAG TPA: protease complex subunit PrcB family protein [Pyrinomonadaceae bacterium]|nr:protease complex subunit PrcB family protein [Pyrinomonadaceae bacterium]
MRHPKFLLLLVLSFTLALGCSAQNKEKPALEKPNEKKMKTEVTPCEPDSLSLGGEIKTLAAGAYSVVEDTFLFTARSKETYALLKSFAENLPPESEIDFSKSAVVAAFAGEKRTGGYSVEIKNSSGRITVEVKEPPKDAITTDALTYPFQIALVAVEEENPLDLAVSENWTKAMQTYRVSTGEFEYSGGIAGRGKKFPVEGTIGVLQMGDYVTLGFDLSSVGTKGKMKLSEIASGVMRDGKIELARLDAGSFSENPKPPLKVTGTSTDGRLVLTFEPHPTTVADGFEARGKLEAVKVN